MVAEAEKESGKSRADRSLIVKESVAIFEKIMRVGMEWNTCRQLDEKGFW